MKNSPDPSCDCQQESSEKRMGQQHLNPL